MKRKLPPHIVLPDGRWRFVKKGRKIKNTRRKKISMARRGRGRRYRSYARKARSWGGGKGSVTKNAIDGIIVGVANTALPEVIPMQDSLVTLGVGWFRKNPTLMTLGGVSLGAQLGGMVGGGLKTGNTGGGWL